MQRQRLAFVSALLFACFADDGSAKVPPVKGPDFEIRYQTKYVDIAPGFTQPICQGSLDEIDRHVEAVAELLNINVQKAGRPTLFWYNENASGAVVDNEEICSWCSSCGGCFNARAMHATLRGLHHELVHAVVTPVWGRTDTLFEEGVAGGLDRIVAGSPSTIYSVMSSEIPTEVVGSGLHSDGHFARWLIDRYGPEKFRELFEPRLSKKSTPAEVFAVVEDVYGLSFEALEAEYFSTAATIFPMPGLCDGLLHVPWSADRWELNVEADCGAPYMFGPNDAGEMYVVATVDIPPELDGELVASWIPFDESAVVWPCLEQPAYDADTEIVRITHIDNIGPTIFRGAGRHRIELPVQESGQVYMRLCEDNGKFPGTYPSDKTIDPENCVGD